MLNALATWLIGALISAAWATGILVVVVAVVWCVAAIVWTPRVATRTGRRLVVTVNRMARDERLPRWLRVLYVACYVVSRFPGPVDNVVLIIPLAIIWFRYRSVLVDVWQATAPAAPAPARAPMLTVEYTWVQSSPLVRTLPNGARVVIPGPCMRVPRLVVANTRA